MGAFAEAAGIGIGDEGLIKKWIKDSVDSVVKEPIANAGFVNVPRFGVANVEGLITAVFIGKINKVVV